MFRILQISKKYKYRELKSTHTLLAFGMVMKVCV